MRKMANAANPLHVRLRQEVCLHPQSRYGVEMSSSPSVRPAAAAVHAGEKTLPGKSQPNLRKRPKQTISFAILPRAHRPRLVFSAICLLSELS